MKKTLYSLLALLMFTLGSATAYAATDGVWTGKYISSVSDPVTEVTAGKYYLLYNTTKQFFVSQSGSSLSGINPLTAASTYASSDFTTFYGQSYMSAVAYVYTDDDGNTKLQFKNLGFLGAMSNSTQCTTNSTGTTVTIAAIDGTSNPTKFTIKDANGEYMDGVYNPVGWWEASTSSGGNGAYQFFEVTLQDCATITYNIYDTDNTTLLSSASSYVAPGIENYPTISTSVEGFYSMTSETDVPSGTLVPSGTTAETYSFTLTYNSDPISNGFPVVSSSTDDATWMKIKLRDKSATLSAVSTTSRSAINCNPGIAINNFAFSTYDDINNSQLWCVTGNPITGFQFHNKYNGYVIGYNGTSDGTNAIMESTSYANSYFDIVKGNGYVLAKIHGGSTYLSDWGGNNSAELKFYSTIDGGSGFSFDTTTELAAADIPSYSGSYVPNFDFTSAKSDSENTGEALYNAHAKKANISSTAYYKIRCSRTDVTYEAAQLRWISTENNPVPTSGELTESNYDDSKYSRTVYRVAETGADAPMLWQFDEQSTNNFMIHNANNGMYLCDPTGEQYTTIVMSVGGNKYAGTYTLEPVSGTIDQWLIKYQYTNSNNETKDCYINAYAGVYTSNTNPVIQNYKDNQASDGGNWWYIIPTTTVGLTIYSDTQYASVCYPFNVTLPDGLTAYIATAANSNSSSETENKTGEVTLSPIDGTVVPANTPVIIGVSSAIESDTEYTLTIGGESTVDTSKNILTGATAARKGFDEGSIYVLTTDGSAAVMRPNTTSGDSYISTIPANHAYLDKNSIEFTDGSSSVNGLYFNFGETTGIHAVSTQTTDEGADTYYDLNGRRVLYPAHGIFVKGNGQKVFIK